MSRLIVTAFYKFLPLTTAQVADFQSTWKTFGRTRDMGGLVLVAPEGINGTICGTADDIAAFKTDVVSRVGDVIFKDSASDTQVFRRWSVKRKAEIVGLHQPDVRPAGPHKHVPPAEWNRLLAEEDVVVIDTRNDYEVAIGKFTGAIDPQLKTFGEFPAFVKQCGIPKDKKVLMYCTGGIRCEKALLEMEKQGYEHVYQLEGGILAYLAQCPNQAFQGECFVFDHRVAVDQALEPSKRYGLCRHCGDPADAPVTCAQCQEPARLCSPCAAQPQPTCSKNCAYHLRRQATTA